jgi:hypothetical protein
MIVTLTAPCHWHRAVLNAGEVVDLPAALALRLVEAGQATATQEPVTCAVEGPPADKLMHQKQKKSTS